MSEYETIKDPFFDPYAPPMAFPGETAGRTLYNVQPSSQYAGQNFSNIPSISFIYQQPTSYLDLGASYIDAEFVLLKDNNAPLATTDSASFVRDPIFFRQGTLLVNGASVEAQSTYQVPVNWTRKLMNMSHAVKASQGRASLTFEDVATVPANETTQPPDNYGAWSTSLNPSTGSFDINVAANATAVTVVASTNARVYAHQLNPNFNPAFGERLRKTQSYGTTATSRSASFRIRLGDIFPFCENPPVLWGGSVNMTLQPATTAELLHNAGSVAGLQVQCRTMTLWMALRQPRVDVAARLLKEASLGGKQKYQWLTADAQTFTIASANTAFSQTLTMGSFSPQWLVCLFKKASPGATDMNQYSFPPCPIISSCPYSSAFVSYAGAQIPQFSYGSAGASDLMRMYQVYCEASGHDNVDGSGAYIPYPQFISNQHLLVFDLRNRAPEASPGSSPSNNLTLNLAFRQALGVDTQLVAVYFGIKEATMTFSTSGVAITSQ